MTTGKGTKQHAKTILENEYTVSTRKIEGVWETMVFDADFEEVECVRHHYKNEAMNEHKICVIHFLQVV